MIMNLKCSGLLLNYYYSILQSNMSASVAITYSLAARSSPFLSILYLFCMTLHRYKCPICEKAFTRLDQLKLVHMRQHETTPGRSPFVCMMCHKSFKAKGKLEQHQVLHSGTACNAAVTSFLKPTPAELDVCIPCKSSCISVTTICI
jgi:uncharacterized Zn-finger protein